MSFDGSANINLPGVNTSGTQDTSGNAATATALATARTIALTGDVTGSATFDGSGNISIDTSSSGGGSWTTSGTTIYYNSGNVGIGVTSPGYKLHVNGSIYGSGVTTPYLTGHGYIAERSYTFNSTSNTTKYFLGWTNQDSMQISIRDSGWGHGGTLYATVYFQWGSTPTIVIHKQSGDYTFYYTYKNDRVYLWFNNSGNSNNNNVIHSIRMRTTAGAINTAEPGSTETYSGTTIGSSAATELTTIRLCSTKDGNVGIGTASPGFPLDVVFSGDSGIRSKSTNSHASLNLDSGSGYGYIRFQDSGSETVWLQSKPTGDVVIRPQGGSETVVFGANGNVGIGATSPGAKLDIAATSAYIPAIRIGTNTTYNDGQLYSLAFGGSGLMGMGLYSSTQTVFGSQGLGIHIPNTEEYSVRTNSWAKLFALDGATQKAYFGGDVGIGTTSPAYKLDVSGTLHAGNSYFDNVYVGGSTSRGLRSVSGQYGTVQTTGGGAGNWEGYSIDGRYVFMSADNNNVGLYNDLDNEWMIYCARNAWTKLYYNGGEKLATTNTGVSVTGELTATTGTFSGRVNLHQSGAGGGQNLFTGLEGATTANGRGQFIISSAYSDLVIASSQANNNHGSNLSFVTYNPANAGDYRKFVINQGNWGSRKQFLDFGYANASRTNPHSYINGTDTVFTLDGINKRVGIKSINPTHNLDVNGNAHISSSLECDGRIYADNGCHVRGDWFRINGSNGIYFESYGGGWRMTDSTYVRCYNDKRIYTGGDILAGGNVTAYSDIRHKKDLIKLNNALEKVEKLNGYTYTSKRDDKRYTGLIAQEVLEVLPEAVNEEEDGYSLAYGNMAGLFVEALKEMKSQLDTALARVDALENTIS